MLQDRRRPSSSGPQRVSSMIFGRAGLFARHVRSCGVTFVRAANFVMRRPASPPRPAAAAPLRRERVSRHRSRRHSPYTVCGGGGGGGGGGSAQPVGRQSGRQQRRPQHSQKAHRPQHSSISQSSPNGPKGPGPCPNPGSHCRYQPRCHDSITRACKPSQSTHHLRLALPYRARESRDFLYPSQRDALDGVGFASSGSDRLSNPYCSKTNVAAEGPEPRRTRLEAWRISTKCACPRW